MKKIYTLVALAAASMIAWTGCVKDNLEEVFEQQTVAEETVEQGDFVYINAKFPDNGPDTRLSYAYSEDGSVLHANWAPGDILYRDGSSSYKFTYEKATGEHTAAFATTASFAANTNYYFTVTYYSQSNGAFYSNKSSYFEYAIQTGSIQDITRFDYLFATAKTNAQKQLPELIEFKRLNSFIEINGVNFGEGVNMEISKVQLVGSCFGTQAQLGLTKTKANFGELTDVFINNGISAQPGYYSDAQHPNFKVENGVLKDTVLISFFPTLTAKKGDFCKLAFYDTEGNIYTLEWESSSAYTSGNVYRVTGKAEKPVVTNIVFEDPVVKSLCVNSMYGDWDINKDGELSDLEASLISTIEYKFGGYNGSEGSAIKKFNELEYFTGLKEIPAQSFLNCRSLEEITLPANIDRIRADAFNGCTSLKEIVVPDKVLQIWGGAFKGCTSLSKVILPDNVDIAPVNASGTRAGQTFQGCTALEEIALPKNLKVIGNNAFQESGLILVRIPEGLTEICQNAFYKCAALSIIYIPASLQTIGASAFNECTALLYANIATGSRFSVSDDSAMIIQDGTTAVSSFGNKTELTFPAGITAIANNFARGSSKLQKVTIPAVASMGTYTFADCPNLTTAIYADDATTGKFTFANDKNLVNVVLPKNATALQQGLFSGCSGLENLTLPAGLTTFDLSVFQNCSSLKSVTLPEGITEVAQSLFSGCASLEHIEIPETVKTLKSNCFEKCTGLKEITLPAGLTRIEGNVFDGCSGITKIDIPEGVNFIGQYAFRNMSLTEIHIPDAVTNLQTGLIAGNKGITSFTFPPNVNTMGSSVFANTGITELTLPASLKTLPTNVFADMKLKTVTLPETLTQLPGGCFLRCTELTSVTIPEGVTTIGSSAFEGCTALTSVAIPAKVTALNMNTFKGCGIKTVVLPEGINNIPMYCFQNCPNLESIEIPDKVATINMYAFDGCSKLKNVTIGTGINMIQLYAFTKCPEMEWIYVKKTTPPTVQFNSLNLEAGQDPYPVYVPDDSVESYKNSGNWKSQYASRIYAISSKQ